MNLYKRLFPDLTGKWRHINLDEEAFARQSELNSTIRNPMLDPHWCTGWIEYLHQIKNCDYSYGGYLENREHLWHGHYMAVGSHWHVGLDFNVPVHSMVHMPYDAELVSYGYDLSTNGGWGGKLVVKSNGMYYCYAHLDQLNPQKFFKAGDLMGRVANYPENGNWFPHLHVQCVSIKPEGGDDLRLTLMDDGYFSWYPTISLDFPMPV